MPLLSYPAQWLLLQERGQEVLFKFKSRVTGDLILLEESGRRILQIIDKDPSPQGIITPEQMPAALAALEQAVQADDAQRQAAQADAKLHDQPALVLEGISLRQRAVPFVQMLKTCQEAQREIVWGV